MTDQRCENCRHWMRPVRTVSIFGEFGTCLRVEHWANADMHTDLAVTTDREDCDSSLKCRAGFGCTLWQPIQVEGVET